MTQLKSRYRYVTLPADHPLATGSRKVPAHRVVLFEKIGPGEHPCYWGCGAVLRWLPGEHTAAAAITTDHLDDDGQNNDPGNLVPSCHTCNVRRARDRRFVDGAFLVVNGVRSAATERVCQRASCGGKFLIETKLLKNAEKRNRVAGRYCSMTCMYARNS